MEQILDFLKGTGFYLLFGKFAENWPSLVMICVSLLLLWLGIKKQFEPLLLVGIAFGMLLTNLTAFTPFDAMYHTDLRRDFMNHEIGYGDILLKGGFLDYLYIAVKTCIYPCLIFVGIGAMSDF